MNTVFNIQRFCINDGPGIRTTVFLKGCPLDCAWCHNPESKSVMPEIMYDPRLCIGCSLCEKTCANSCHSLDSGTHLYSRENCISCGDCSKVCPSKALETAGYEKDADSIIAEVMRDEAFYATSGGGLTLSGGEPMLQIAFTRSIIEKAKEKGLHVCMETSGFAPKKHFEEIAPFVDIFLFDYKLTDDKDHIKYTGASNKKIIENLHLLDSLGNSIILRCPIIPGINDNDEHFFGIAQTANSINNIIEINIEPYHPMGSSKSKLLGKEYTVSANTFPSDDTVTEWISKISVLTDVLVKKS